MLKNRIKTCAEDNKEKQKSFFSFPNFYSFFQVLVGNINEVLVILIRIAVQPSNTV
jgi:hypothetical protein